MEQIKQNFMYVAFGVVLLTAAAAPVPAEAGELFALPTEDGLELYLADGVIEPVSLEGPLFANRSTLMLTSEPTRTIEDRLAGFRGFRSPFPNSAIEIEARFADLLRQPATRVAHQTQTGPLQLRSLPPASLRVAWEAREGWTILSF